MKDFLGKCLFLIFPLGLFIIGIWLMILGAQFWLDITLPSELQPNPVGFGNNLPISMKVFLPKVIRSQDSPVRLDIEITKQAGYQVGTAGVGVLVGKKDCDYLSLNEPYKTINFNPSSTLEQIETFSPNITIRNTPPPKICTIIVDAVFMDGTAHFEKSIPVDNWTERSLSLIKLLGGLLVTVFGFNGLKGLFS